MVINFLFLALVRLQSRKYGQMVWKGFSIARLAKDDIENKVHENIRKRKLRCTD